MSTPDRRGDDTIRCDGDQVPCSRQQCDVCSNGESIGVFNTSNCMPDTKSRKHLEPRVLESSSVLRGSELY